jgi:hypothetical protein
MHHHTIRTRKRDGLVERFGGGIRKISGNENSLELHHFYFYHRNRRRVTKIGIALAPHHGRGE